jgi:beta-lactam-binding protein with PASTA domain
MFRKQAAFVLLFSACCVPDAHAQHRTPAPAPTQPIDRQPREGNIGGARPQDGKTQPGASQVQGNVAGPGSPAAERPAKPVNNQSSSPSFGATVTSIWQHITTQPGDSRVRVPSVLKKNQTTAMDLLSAAHLQATFSGELTGVATAQHPEAGQWAPSGSNVAVTLANPPAIVPSLYGLTLQQAQLQLQKALLAEGPASGNNAQGSTVVGQSIVAGSEEPRGTLIGVTLAAPAQATGSPTPGSSIPSGTPNQPASNPAPVVDQPVEIRVPSLQNKSLDEAKATLAVVRLLGSPTGSLQGVVDTQNPGAGKLVPAGSQVDFHLKLETVSVPNVLQDAQSAAAKRLGTFGLKPRYHYAADRNSFRALVVVSQTPTAGTDVAIGSSVTVVMGNAPLPGWVWPAAAGTGVLGLVGIRKLIRRGRNRTVNPADWILSPRKAIPQVRIGQGGSPKIQFSFGLRHHAPPACYRSKRQPILTRKG